MTGLELFDIAIRSLGIISIGISAFALWRSGKYTKKQWNFNAFTHYTKRFEDIMASFPENAYVLRFELDKVVTDQEEVRISVLKYLNMTSEEYYLHKEGYLDDKVWEIWLPEIRRTLRSPLFVSEWTSGRI